ncbi:MAG: response regulator [Bacteriovoracaceae bacterium]|nr:response regulator [Bacteriovoracaceae bacterium]
MSLLGKTVLVIDDDDSFRDYVTKILNAQGITTKEAKDLLETESVLSTFTPDVIILDLNLGDGSLGHRFLEDRQKNPARQKIPVIVCSADSTSEIVKKCILSGADDYLVKPIKQTWLLQRLHKHILQKKLLSRRFPTETAPLLSLEFEAQLVGIGEGHAVLRSQAKFQKDAKGEIAAKLFTENDILVKTVRMDNESRAGVNGLYDTYCTLIGITEKEAGKIRKIKAGWRT